MQFITKFRTHPASVGESYFGHMAFAARFGTLLVAAGCAAFIHALIPPLFETTAGRIVQGLASEIGMRNGAR